MSDGEVYQILGRLLSEGKERKPGNTITVGKMDTDIIFGGSCNNIKN